MKAEDARPLNEFTNEELISIKNFFNGTGDIVAKQRLINEFIYACDNFAFKAIDVSDFGSGKKKIATTLNSDYENDLVSIQSIKAIKKWNPSGDASFATFFYAVLNNLRKIPINKSKDSTRMSRQIYISLRELVAEFYPDRNPNDWISDFIYYDSPVLLKAVESAFPDSDEIQIKKIAEIYVGESIGKNTYSMDNLKLKNEAGKRINVFDFITVKDIDFNIDQNGVEIAVFGRENVDVALTRIDKVIHDMEAKKLFRKDTKEKLAMVITISLCKNMKTVTPDEIKMLSEEYECITNDYSKLFDFVKTNKRYPKATDIAAMYGVGKTAISNIWKKFTDFAKEDELS